MKTITFDKFNQGLDVRKTSSAASADSLRVLTNAYITRGGAIRKRPGMVFYGTLTTGTKGLVSAGGKLNTFYPYNATPITHAATVFAAKKLVESGVLAYAGGTLAKVHFGFIFNGYIYVGVEFSDGVTRHYWIDSEAAANSIQSRAAGSNCPNSTMAVKAASRIYAIDPANNEVNFTYQGSAIDWNTVAAAATDAGSLPFGRNSPGAETPTGLSFYNGRLVVFGVDNTQLYLVSADASLIALDKAIGGIGCTAAKTPANFASDLIFLAKAGFRSVNTQAVSENLQDTDVGSPIDALTRALSAQDPKSAYFPEQNQYWSLSPGVSTTEGWIYTYSRTAKITAWSKYVLPFVIDDVTNHAGDLYTRSGDTVYIVDNSDSVFYDGTGTPYNMVVEMPFLHLKAPGKEKSIYSMDLVMPGTVSAPMSVDVQFRYDPNDPTKITDPITITNDTRPMATIPLEITTTAIAPVFTSSSTSAVQIDAIAFNFDVLDVN